MFNHLYDLFSNWLCCCCCYAGTGTGTGTGTGYGIKTNNTHDEQLDTNQIIHNIRNAGII